MRLLDAAHTARIRGTGNFTGFFKGDCKKAHLGGQNLPPRGYMMRNVPKHRTAFEDLRQYYDRLGVEFYGQEWGTNYYGIDARHRKVADELHYRLYYEEIDAGVWLRVKPLSQDNLEKIQFLVDPKFWHDNDAKIIRSFVKSPRHIVPYEYLFELNDGIQVRLEDKYEKPNVGYHTLKIINRYGQKVSAASQWPPTFSARFAKYDRLSTTEMIAVAWRYIAINELKADDRTLEQIATDIEFYMGCQGLQANEVPGRDKIYQIVRRVVSQLRRSDLISSVLVSSNSAHALKD